MSVTIDVLQNSWKVSSRAYVAKNGALRVGLESQLLPFLLSPRNRNAGTIARTGANNLQRSVDATGKDIYEVVVKWPQMQDQNARRPDTSQGFCDVSGQSIRYNAQKYELNKKTSATITIDGNINHCSEETRQQYFDDSFNSLVSNAVFNLARDVEDEFFAKTGTSYRHFGNLPKLQTGVTRPAGEALPLFRTTESEINSLGDQILERDRELGGIMERVFLGDYSLRGYIKYKEMSGLNDSGYDFSMLSEINRASYLRSNRLFTNTGLQRPVVSIPVGAAQLVTHAEFAGRPDVGVKVQKTGVNDPVFGLQWNLITVIDDCDGRYTKTHLTLELTWALVVNPICEPNDLRLDGTNGIYLYNIVCSDASICDLIPVDALYNSASTPKDECANVDADFCNTGCNVAINAYVSTNGQDYIVTANDQPSAGAFVADYTWTLNGAPIVDTTRNIKLDNSTLVDGDVIAVSFTDSLGCTASATFVVDNGCPSPVYSLTALGSTQTIANGQTIALGSFAAPVGDLEIELVVSLLNSTPLVVTAGTASGVAVLSSTSGFPDTLQLGDNGTILVIANKVAAGARTIVFSVSSNDCNTPVFTATVTYTITL